MQDRGLSSIIKLNAMMSLVVFCVLQSVAGENLLIEKVKANETEVQFRGKIVDQNGDPVTGAKIHFRISTAHSQRDPEFEVQSEGDGTFTIDNGIKATWLIIDRIEKEGYEYHRESDTQEMFNYSKIGSGPIPGINDVAVFYMRKKANNPAVLIRSSFFDTRISSRHPVIYLWFVSRKFGYFEYEEDYDLIISGAFNQVKSECDITFTVPSLKGGIVSDKFLVEAPKEGYEHQYHAVVKLNNEIDDKNYLYVKSGSLGVYSRIKISDLALFLSRDTVSMNLEIDTNPYGDRKLEDNTDIPQQLHRQLESEAQTIYSRGKLPAIPENVLGLGKGILAGGLPKTGFSENENVQRPAWAARGAGAFPKGLKAIIGVGFVDESKTERDLREGARKKAIENISEQVRPKVETLVRGYLCSKNTKEDEEEKKEEYINKTVETILTIAKEHEREIEDYWIDQKTGRMYYLTVLRLDIIKSEIIRSALPAQFMDYVKDNIDQVFN